MAPAVCERVTAEQADQDVKPFVDALGPNSEVWIFTEGGELLVCLRSKPNADHDPACGQQVQRGDFTRELPRTPSRQRGHHDPETHVNRGGSDRRQSHIRIRYGPTAFPIGHVIPDEHAVPPCAFRTMREAHQDSDVPILTHVRQTHSATSGGLGAHVYRVPARRQHTLPVCTTFI